MRASLSASGHAPRVLLALLLSMDSTSAARAQDRNLPPPTAPSAIGQRETGRIDLAATYVIRSQVMNEDRELLIALPESYARTATGYPVLFVLDGSSHILHATATSRFLASARNRIPEMIVVAVPNTNRNRDLTPGAGAERFERFFGEELIPWVERAFRTVPERVIMGHSLGGSFVTHALLNRPDLFDVFVAVSAPLWRYDSLTRDMRVGLPRAAQSGEAIYLTVGEHENPQLRGGVREFARALMSADSTVVPRWSFMDLRDEDHSSTSQRSLYAALETHYASYRFPFFEEIAELDSLAGLAGMEAHYRRAAARFGIGPSPPESRVLSVGRIYVAEARHSDVRKLATAYRTEYPRAAELLLNSAGYDLMRRGDVPRAVEVFRENAALFPDSPNVHDSLADGYCRAGDRAAALESIRRAVSAAERRSHPRLPIYRQRAERPCPE